MFGGWGLNYFLRLSSSRRDADDSFQHVERPKRQLNQFQLAQSNYAPIEVEAQPNHCRRWKPKIIVTFIRVYQSASLSGSPHFVNWKIEEDENERWFCEFTSQISRSNAGIKKAATWIRSQKLKKQELEFIDCSFASLSTFLSETWLILIDSEAELLSSQNCFSLTFLDH